MAPPALFRPQERQQEPRPVVGSKHQQELRRPRVLVLVAPVATGDRHKLTLVVDENHSLQFIKIDPGILGLEDI